MDECFKFLIGSHGALSTASIILTSIMAIICMVVFGWTICNVVSHRKQETSVNRTKNIKLVQLWDFETMVTLLAFVFATVIQSIRTMTSFHIIWPINNDYSYDYIDTACNFDIALLYNNISLMISIIAPLTQNLLIFLYFTRLFLLFDGTAFEISKHTKRVVIIFFLLYLIMSPFIVYSMFYENETGSHIFEVFWSLFDAQYVIMSLYLCFILYKKFKQLINMTLTVNKEQSDIFLNLLTKLSLLIIFTLVTVLCVTIIGVVCIFGIGWNIKIAAILPIFWNFERVITVLSISLQYPFGDYIYFKLLGYCDQLCKNKIEQSHPIKLELAQATTA